MRTLACVRVTVPLRVLQYLQVDAWVGARTFTAVYQTLAGLLKELSVLRGQLPKAAAFPGIGPGRYNSTTKEIYEITKARRARGGVFAKGGPMPIHEDFVLREAGE